MEYFGYLIEFGGVVRGIRKKKKMNQIEFYEFLFPGRNKNEENIKKKMNAIENGKQKSIDYEFIYTICRKCDVSADYLLGISSHKNHDVESICEYTGLDESAVLKLHDWKEAKSNGADLSLIDNGASSDEEELEMQYAYKKQAGINYLRIVNYLFNENPLPDIKNKRRNKGPYPNLNILYSIQLMCMAKPNVIYGNRITDTDIVDYETDERDNASAFVPLDIAKPLLLQDDNGVWYPVDLNEVLMQSAKRHLAQSLECLREQFHESNE